MGDGTRFEPGRAQALGVRLPPPPPVRVSLHKDFRKVAEWFIAPSWKGGGCQSPAGSNPVLPAKS